MTLEEEIGQMLVFGWTASPDGDSSRVDAHARRLIDEMQVGGVIVMGRNAPSATCVRASVDELQARAAARGLPPLLVCIDQEGGEHARLRPPDFQASTGAASLGATGDRRLARAEAAAVGAELRSLGINWNLAPVLDVNSNPANPVIGRRAFGAEPDTVSSFGQAVIRGYQDDAGILACGKHFPGHGDTCVDSHEALPVIPHDLERMWDVELAPFRSAVDAGVGSIMTSHILFPALDPERPATFSRPVLHGLLRQKIGFAGLVVTDCLEMKGARVGHSFGEAAVRAVEAGADVLLCCHTLDSQRQVRDGLLQAVVAGRIRRSILSGALERIQAAKDRFANAPASGRPAPCQHSVRQHREE